MNLILFYNFLTGTPFFKKNFLNNNNNNRAKIYYEIQKHKDKLM